MIERKPSGRSRDTAATVGPPLPAQTHESAFPGRDREAAPLSRPPGAPPAPPCLSGVTPRSAPGARGAARELEEHQPECARHRLDHDQVHQLSVDELLKREGPERAPSLGRSIAVVRGVCMPPGLGPRTKGMLVPAVEKIQRQPGVRALHLRSIDR